MSKYSDYQQARREFVVPQLFTAMLLNLIFGISWIFALLGTDADASSTLALGSQYAFSFLIMLYAVLVLLLSFVRFKDARNAWLTCCGTVTGKSQSYSVSRQQEMQRQRDDTFGMSNRLEKSPTPTNDAPPDYDEAALLRPATPSPTIDSEEGMMEVKQPGEEEKEVETVLMNNDADDEDEKKTDL